MPEVIRAGNLDRLIPWYRRAAWHCEVCTAIFTLDHTDDRKLVLGTWSAGRDNGVTAEIACPTCRLVVQISDEDEPTTIDGHKCYRAPHVPRGGS